MTEEAIFVEAIARKTPKERSAYLDQVCGGDAQLRARIDGLLQAHDHPDRFFDAPVSDVGETIDLAPITESPGATIGPYKLREQIGEGGMGVVFVAEQERPVRRKVALKVIKPGMDTKEVIARFEAERQALALMDHPNIATVLDAGSTATGRPYFVMEFVRGIPITDYCDQNKLTVRDRLELFIQVCQAIQHAHQKGIIHRDVKPSNVLVTLHDGKPVPKVIDFGVAKATHQRLTERTIYTRLAQFIGTPLYMSPEQAALSGLDVDTRADVYSLGVLLYELLTGTTPFDKERFAKAAYDEFLRIMRDEEPPKPSTKISTLGAAATAVSMKRNTELRKLCQLVRGDLDWIVMKALDKDRTRRYEAASALADDVTRFLHDEPVVARPPSLAYRFTKFANRNRPVMVTSAAVFLSLVVGIVTTASMARNLKLEVDRKNAILLKLAQSCYDEAVTAALAGDAAKARRALLAASAAGASSYQIAVVDGLIALNSGKADEAAKRAEEALADTSLPNGATRIAAHSLLSSASIVGGDLYRWERELHLLRKQKPQSDTDRLLVAYALVAQDPPQAMRQLDSRPSIGRSPVGVFIRGFANCLEGLDKRDAGLLDESLQDFKYAQFLCQNTASAKAWRLHALAGAIDVARFEGNLEKVSRYAGEGTPVARDLWNAADYPWGNYCNWLFYRASGEDEPARRVIRRVGACRAFSLAIVADCIRQKGISPPFAEFEKAIAANGKGNEYARLALAHIAADPANTRPSNATELLNDLTNSPSVLLRRHALCAFCLSHTADQVHRLASEAMGNLFLDAYKTSDLFNGTDCLQFLAGNITEEMFLGKAADHGYSISNAHFTVAMMHLAEGDRPGAIEHFRQCAAACTVGSIDYELGRAYLARMTADPSFPRLNHSAAK